MHNASLINYIIYLKKKTHTYKSCYNFYILLNYKVKVMDLGIYCFSQKTIRQGLHFVIIALKIIFTEITIYNFFSANLNSLLYIFIKCAHTIHLFL